MTSDLVALANNRQVKRISLFAEAAKQMVIGDLASRYERQRRDAPSRHSNGKRYFVGHTGVTSSSGATNRLEEHLAVALGDHESLQVSGAGSLRILDHQVPLKANRSDSGIGKIDLLACGLEGRLDVVELRVERPDRGMGDTPLRALLEGLAYAAIVHANEPAFREEVAEEFGFVSRTDPPSVTVAAPAPFWQRWRDHKTAAQWIPSVADLTRDIRDSLGVTARFVDLGPVGVTPGVAGRSPRLTASFDRVSSRCESDPGDVCLVGHLVSHRRRTHEVS